MINFFKKKTFWQKISVDFVFLYIGLLMFSAIFLIFSGQTLVQVITVLATGLYYVLWGTIHHAREGDFHISIFLEYFLIATLVVAVLLTLIIRT